MSKEEDVDEGQVTLTEVDLNGKESDPSFEGDVKATDQVRSGLMVYIHSIIAIIRLAVPISITYSSEYLIILIELVFFGSLGTVEFTGAALGASFANVSGYSVYIGMLSGMDTLISQAFGANEKHRIGVALQQAICANFILVFLIFPVWFFSYDIFVLIGQDHEVAYYAALYLKITWFGYFPAGLYSCLRRYLQNQSIIVPSFLSGVTSLTFSIIVNIVVFKIFKIESFAAIAIIHVCTSCCAVFTLINIIFWGNLYKDTWAPISINSLRSMGQFLKLGFQGTITVCAEWWGFEIHTLIAGLFGVEALASMTMIMNLLAILYMTIMGIAMATTTRVGNAVGGGDIRAAIVNSRCGLFVGIFAQLVQISMVYFGDNVWPYLFTDDPAVVASVQKISLLVCCFMLPDATQNILGGVLRGTGRLEVSAVTGLIAYYVISMPIGLTLAFAFGMGIMGQWLGLACGLTFSAGTLIVFYLRTNWEKVVHDSKVRLSKIKTDSDPDLSSPLSTDTDTSTKTSDVEMTEVVVEDTTPEIDTHQE